MPCYYSLITRRTINFEILKKNLDELTDDKYDEFEYFIEKEFIGIEPGIPSLGLNKFFGLLFTPNQDNFPIIQENNFSIDVNSQKIIYEDNKDLFDFINIENKDEIKDKKQNKLISLDDYIYTIIDINNKQNFYKYCNYETELYLIYLDRIIDY